MTNPETKDQKTNKDEDRRRYLPWWWHFLLFVSLMVGMVFVGFNWGLAEGFIGILLIAIPVSYWVIRLCMIGVEKAFYGKVTTTRRDLWPPALVGSLEGLMYPVAFLVDETGLVGVWLVIKTAGQWAPNFGVNITTRREEMYSHRSFDRFLIGNALRIIFSVATFVAMKVFVLEVWLWR